MEDFSEHFLSDLKHFSQIAWGNPQAFLRKLPRDPGVQAPDVEFLDLTQYFPSIQDLFNGFVYPPRRILVRKEYRVAMEALMTYENGAYVSGQPGIGKTVFLFYALIHFLGQRQPVAVQHLGGGPFYVLFDGWVTVHPLTHTHSLFRYDLVWALSDSNAHVQYPPASFMAKQGHIRIIQTTSPEASRWKQWSKHTGASCYIMDIWTKDEIVSLATLAQRDIGRMVELARKWGCVPRTLLWAIDEPDEEVERRYRNDAQAAIAGCENIIDEGQRLNLPLPSPFYFVRPATLNSGTISRKLASVFVPTPFLYIMLAEGLQKRNNSTRVQFYAALSQCPETRQGAGRIYETWFHSFVTAGGRVPCQWVAQYSSNDIAQLPTELPRTTILPPSTLDVLATKLPPYFWLPPYTNFPGIDSALVLEKEIFAFQITISAGRKSPIKGLSKLRKYLPVNLKDLPWRVVFIGPELDQVEHVARDWAGKLYFPKGKHVAVGWSAVDPIRKEVPFKAYYADETEPVPEESDDSDEEMMNIEG